MDHFDFLHLVFAFFALVPLGLEALRFFGFFAPVVDEISTHTHVDDFSFQQLGQNLSVASSVCVGMGLQSSW